MILRNPHFQPVQFSTTAHFYHDLKALLVEPADLERVTRHAVVYEVVHDLAEEDEQAEPTPIDYEGASVILTRENTEPNNRTITSKEQAELICEDGKWFVLNKSELGSTYLEANRKLEIQQGDIIVLGDRRFKFEVE